MIEESHKQTCGEMTWTSGYGGRDKNNKNVFKEKIKEKRCEGKKRKI